MFTEIRSQRNTSTAIRKNPEVFRLKKNHQNLDTYDYASYLCQYLYQTRGITGLSMGNIQNVLNGLKHISNIDKVPVTVPSNVNAEAIENIS